jgi:hypothetical protein
MRDMLKPVRARTWVRRSTARVGGSACVWLSLSGASIAFKVA